MVKLIIRTFISTLHLDSFVHFSSVRSRWRMEDGTYLVATAAVFPRGSTLRLLNDVGTFRLLVGGKRYLSTCLLKRQPHVTRAADSLLGS